MICTIFIWNVSFGLLLWCMKFFCKTKTCRNSATNLVNSATNLAEVVSTNIEDTHAQTVALDTRYIKSNLLLLLAVSCESTKRKI